MRGRDTWAWGINVGGVVFTAEVSTASSLGRAGVSLTEGTEMEPKWKLPFVCVIGVREVAKKVW